jgi:hypothetical protein
MKISWQFWGVSSSGLFIVILLSGGGKYHPGLMTRGMHLVV